MIGSAGDSRTSSVPGLKATPSTVTRLPFRSLPTCSFNRRSICSGCVLLVESTASSIGVFTPRCWACAVMAFTSFGKQLPPKPQPAHRKEVAPAVFSLPSPSR